MLGRFVFLSLLRFVKILLSIGSLLVFARVVGVNEEMDYWVLSFSIITGLGMVLWGALNEVLRSRYIKIKNENIDTELSKYIVSLHFGTAAVNLVIIFIILIVNLVNTSLNIFFADSIFSQVLYLLALLAPTLILSQYIAVSTCIMNCEGKVYTPEVVGILGSLLNIFIVFIWFEHLGVYALILGYYTFLLISCCYSHYYNISRGIFSLKWLFQFKISYFIPFVSVAGYLVAAYGSGQLNMLVEKTLAANMEVGTLSLLNYASQIKGALQAVFSSVLLSIVVPVMTSKYVKNDNVGYAKALDQGQSIIFCLLLIIIPVLVSSPEAVTKIVFAPESLTNNQTENFFYLLQGYAWALFPVLLYVIYSCALVSIGKVKEYAVLAIVTQLFSILIALAFVNSFSFLVFPVALCISHFVVAMIMLKKVGIEYKHNFIRIVIYIVLTAALTFILIYVKPYFQVLYAHSIFELVFSSIIALLGVAGVLLFDKKIRGSIFSKN